jgi:hypothetical protein
MIGRISVACTNELKEEVLNLITVDPLFVKIEKPLEDRIYILDKFFEKQRYL